MAIMPYVFLSLHLFDTMFPRWLSTSISLYFSRVFQWLHVSKNEHRHQVLDRHQSIIPTLSLNFRHVYEKEFQLWHLYSYQDIFADVSKEDLKRKINNESSTDLEVFYRSQIIRKKNMCGNEPRDP